MPSAKHEDTGAVVPSSVMREVETTPIEHNSVAGKLNLTEDPIVAFVLNVTKKIDLSVVRTHPRIFTVGIGLALAVLLMFGLAIGGKVFGGENSQQTFAAALSEADRAQQAAKPAQLTRRSWLGYVGGRFRHSACSTIKKEDQSANQLSNAIKTEMAKLDRVVSYPNPGQPVTDPAAAGATSDRSRHRRRKRLHLRRRWMGCSGKVASSPTSQVSQPLSPIGDRNRTNPTSATRC